MYFGDEDWLDKLVDSDASEKVYPGVCVLEEFVFTQAQSYEIADGIATETLHKSMPRLSEDPVSRSFFREFYDFGFNRK